MGDSCSSFIGLSWVCICYALTNKTYKKGIYIFNFSKVHILNFIIVFERCAENSLMRQLSLDQPIVLLCFMVPVYND